MIKNNFYLIGVALTDVLVVNASRYVYSLRMEIEDDHKNKGSNCDIYFYPRYCHISKQNLVGCLISVTGFMSTRYNAELRNYTPVLIGTKIEVISR